MAQVTFASNASPSLTLLDQNFSQLYDMRELISTPSYVGANEKIVITSTGSTSFRGNFVEVGPTAAASGAGGSLRLRDDTGAQRWLIGFLGTAAATALTFFDVVAGVARAMFDSSGNFLINRAAQASGGKLEVTGNVVLQPSSGAPTLTVNGDMSFQLVSNTSLKVLVRGSDGTTRSVTLTLV